MVGRALRAALVALVLAMVVQSLPDLKRYLEIRQM